MNIFYQFSNLILSQQKMNNFLEISYSQNDIHQNQRLLWSWTQQKYHYGKNIFADMMKVKKNK